MGNSRRGAVDPFIVMDVMEAARAAEAQGRDIVHMEVGQPGTGAPKAALDRLAEDLSADPLGYTVALGLPELRARIAQHYGEVHDVDLDPARVVVTAGASGAFLLSFTALFDTGSRVGLGAPAYPSYRQILKAQDLVPVDLPTRIEDGFHPRPEVYERHNLRGLIVASPANPTGSILWREPMGALAQAASDAGAALISDEIYHGLEFGQPATTALALTDEVHVVNSFSKYFSMTGWRVGWLVVPQGHVRTIERLAQNMFICPPNASQRLALYAFDAQDELQANVATYRANRDRVLAALPTMGLARFAPPDGAFYVYVDVSHVTDDALSLCRQILDEVGVAVTPGLDFDPADGASWLRLSYARSEAEVSEGLARLATFFGARA